MNWIAPKHLINYSNTKNSTVFKTRLSEHNNTKKFGTGTENFKDSVFPFCVNEWYKSDISLRKVKNIKCFKISLI